MRKHLSEYVVLISVSTSYLFGLVRRTYLGQYVVLVLSDNSCKGFTLIGI